jgi:hypothetical protein
VPRPDLSLCIVNMEIEIKSFLASLGATESCTGLLLVAGALFLFRDTTFGQNLGHIPLVREELGKSKRIQAYKSSEKEILADGYKKVRSSGGPCPGEANASTQFSSIFRMSTPEGISPTLPIIAGEF